MHVRLSAVWPLRLRVLSLLALLLAWPGIAFAESPPASLAEAGDPTPTQILLGLRSENWQQIVDSRALRVLVVTNRTHFFLDGGRQRGIIADALQEWENDLNRELNLGARRLHVIPIPVRRDQLIPFLEQGRAEIAAANLTITPEREERVDFSRPTSKPIDEVVVTGPGAPKLERIEDLAGQIVHIRRSSSFWVHLEALNARFAAEGLAPIQLQPADEFFETEDLLEMASSGLAPITIADSQLARFWSDVLPDLAVHTELKIAEGTRIGWAIRKDAAGLKPVVDRWVEANREGRLLGNMLLKRYLRQNRWVRNATTQDEEDRLLAIFDHFQVYAGRYGFDWLLVAAQGYQESGLDQSRRSHRGAIGVMQIMPSTARDPSVAIEHIELLENNIHAGTRYLRHVIDSYFDDPKIDAQNRMLFAFAAYNAGPTRIRRLQREAGRDGLDPTQWFDHVERVAARDIGRETVQYVANIYKYYVAFSQLVKENEGRRSARAGLEASAPASPVAP